MKNSKSQVGAIILLLVIIIILLIILIGNKTGEIPNFNFDKVTGNTPLVTIEESKTITQEYQITDFSKIKLSGKGNIYLTDDSDYSVKITAEENIIELLEVEKDFDTLNIGTKRFILLPNKPIDIFISAPNIEKISISGSGNIITKNPLTTESFELTISGSGKGDIYVDTKNLETNILGSGDITYSGYSDNNKIRISGSGDVQALDLENSNTEIIITGSGYVETSPSQELLIEISGLGTVKYRGNPSVKQTISGRGKIEKM